MDEHALESWRRRAEAELAGAAFETLRTPIADGLTIEPLYVAAPHAGHVGAGACALAEGEPAVPEGAALVDTRAQAGPVAALAHALTGFVAALEAPRVIVRTSVGSAMLVEIAKLRALRRLAARAAELAGAGPAIEVHAYVATGEPTESLIETSIGVFASVVGGADLVVPGGSGGARRLADNAVRIALAEAHLGAVADPAAGSFALESLTDALCEAAWEAARDASRSRA